MRTIKFRGKSLYDFTDYKWCFGSLVHYEDRRIDGGMDGTIHDYNVYMIVEDDIEHKVDPKSIGQFTGFFDCNGKEIFEGDFIQNDEHHEFIYLVDIVDGCWSGFARPADDFVDDDEILAWLLQKAPFKVIGNIHFNPDLLVKSNV